MTGYCNIMTIGTVYENDVDSCKSTQNERMTNKRSFCLSITATTKTISPQPAIEAAAHHTIFAPITATTIEIKICLFATAFELMNLKKAVYIHCFRVTKKEVGALMID
ncbi:hypothetical protein WUBG_05361 [Wuchereria bancrofti]|uniref:Uncharacterized protein n=1 Tax=Wuchereria bancrofti TaxID=6293 RepID=J9F8P7_WUCBA|nr:hypothetical protein WUBG_05361 [Wuchereria bancrofti]